MIILIVATLVFMAVRLIVTFIAAVVAIRMSLDDGAAVAVHRQRPQDAPPIGPWDPVRGPQDAPRPQDASIDPNVLRLQDAPGSPRLLSTAPQSPPTVRWMRLLITVRGVGSGMPVGTHCAEQALDERTTVLDAVPRPTTGPAYLGGRDDAAYLRGWDDGVDWIRQGNPEREPSWSSAAYMTGWNDSVKAIAKARRLRACGEGMPVAS